MQKHLKSASDANVEQLRNQITTTTTMQTEQKCAPIDCKALQQIKLKLIEKDKLIKTLQEKIIALEQQT
jgi:hypothetical protein